MEGWTLLIVWKTQYYKNVNCHLIYSEIEFNWIKIDEIIIKFIWKWKGPRISKAFMERTKLEVTMLDIKIYHKTVVIKKIW